MGDYVLIGMLDSPFVRRVAVALEVAGIRYENRSLATFGNADEFAKYSPLKRAPTLVLPGGEPLFDSHIIFQYLAEAHATVAALLPATPAHRLRCLQVMGAATGLGDKAVSLVYEKVFHGPGQRHPAYVARQIGQLNDTLSWLEARAPSGWVGEAGLTLADITVGTCVTFATEAHADAVHLDKYPRVSAWVGRLNALPAFSRTYLKLDPPTG